MRRVFIDLGAYNGDTVEMALANGHYDIVYAFEPLRSNFELLAKRYGKDEKVILINCAADTFSGEAVLFKGNATYGDTGGSLCSGMTTTSPETETVKVLNIAEFIKQQFIPDDRIDLKLDIEGKEYDVLARLIEDRIIHQIHYIYCEWHYSLIGMTPDQHFAFVRKLRVLGFDLCGNKEYDEFINVHNWGRRKIKAIRHYWYYRYRLRKTVKGWLPDPVAGLLRRIWP